MDDESRVQYEGFRPGMYVRVEICSLPCEFVTNFDPHYPVILGGLGSSEGNVGYLQVRPLEHPLTSLLQHCFTHPLGLCDPILQADSHIIKTKTGP